MGWLPVVSLETRRGDGAVSSLSITLWIYNLSSVEYPWNMEKSTNRYFFRQRGQSIHSSQKRRAHGGEGGNKGVTAKFSYTDKAGKGKEMKPERAGHQAKRISHQGQPGKEE